MAEIPPLRLRFTEYRAERVLGTCGKIHRAEFPTGVEAPVQYGRRLKAVALYLSAYQLLPQARTCQSMADLCGVPMSEGTLNRIMLGAHRKLEPTERGIEAALAQEPVLGLDETGCFLSGARLWQHRVSSGRCTHYGVHASRGLTGTERCAPFLVHFTGVAVHTGGSRTSSYPVPPTRCATPTTCGSWKGSPSARLKRGPPRCSSYCAPQNGTPRRRGRPA